MSMNKFPTLKGAAGATLLVVLIAAVTTACAPPEITSAKLYINNQDYGNARRSLEEAIRLYPDNAEAYFIFGELEAMLSNWAEAKQHYDRASALSPTFRAEAQRKIHSYWVQHYNDGYIFLQRNDLERAEASFQNATTLKPDDPASWMGLATVYGQQQRYDEAIAMYGKVLELDPQHVEARTNSGYLNYNNGNYLEAVRLLEPLRDDFLADSDFVSTLAFSYQRLEETDKARQLYEDSLEFDPENLYTHMDLAKMYTEQGQDDLALPHFITALELNPFDVIALDNIAVTYLELEQAEQAVPYLEKSREIEPYNPITWIRLGTYYYRVGAATGDQAMIAKGREYMQRAEELQAIPPIR